MTNLNVNQPRMAESISYQGLRTPVRYATWLYTRKATMKDKEAGPILIDGQQE